MCIIANNRGERCKAVGLLVMLTFFTTAATPADAASNCWVIVPPINVTVRYDASILLGQSWPDPQSAVEAGFVEIMRQGPVDSWGPVFGLQCNIGGSEYRGNISQMLRLPMQISSLPGDSLVDPNTGLPIVYQQSAIFQNEFGEDCYDGWYGRYTTVITVDGNYYGKPQCKARYIIKLAHASGMPASNATLASVEPGNQIQILARVYDQNNQLVPNVGIELKLEVVNQSAGHHHGDDTAVARTGTLASNAIGAVVSDNGKTLTGNTGTSGLQFQYNAPRVSGDIDINANCTDGKNCTQEGARRVWVGVKDLVPLGNSQYFVPVGDTLNHFDNHYLTLEASSRINVLAALYRARFPNYPLLHLNDASLERGGLFDVNSDWAPPHFEHCRGTEIDVRANDALGAIPSTITVRQVFEELAKKVGADPMWEIPKDKNKNPRPDLRHYHVRLAGGKPQCP